jgi:hypothetical protein
MARNLITETLVLPSAATHLYGDQFDGHLTLRAMTTDEERMRLSGQSFYQTMSAIVNECIVDNKNPDGTYKLDCVAFTDFDFFAVCVKLRIMSYGPKYRTIATCPKCGRKFQTSVNLADLAYNLVPEDFTEPYTVGPLPLSGDTLGCRFLRIKDRIDIEKQRDIILANNPKYQGDPTFNLEMERRIMEVNGKPLDYITAGDYIRDMVAGDSVVYHEEVDKSKDFGVILFNLLDHCEDEDCDGQPFWILRADREFFRPCLDS